MVLYFSVCLQSGPLKTTVTGVEMFKKILDRGEVSKIMEPSLLLRSFYLNLNWWIISCVSISRQVIMWDFFFVVWSAMMFNGEWWVGLTQGYQISVQHWLKLHMVVKTNQFIFVFLFLNFLLVKLQVVTKPGALKTYKKFEAEIYVLSKDEGGRHTAFFSNYKPQFYLRTADITGKVELPENVKMVMPGDNVAATFELMSPVPLEIGR